MNVKVWILYTVATADHIRATTSDDVSGKDGWGSRNHEILVGLLLNPDNAYRSASP
jgi:hypothetical protein